MSVAFVLSGGASLGAVQAGMLLALYERGIAPDLVVGTSAGALNGAFVASRPPTVKTANELGQVWRDLRRGELFPLNPVTGLFGFLGTSDHLVPARGLRRVIERQLTHERLEQLPVPLHVIATDLLSGREVRLSRGPLVDALEASAAIPGVLPPVELNGRLLIDGGVANNTPLSDAIELGAERVYVLPTGGGCALEEPPRGALAMLVHATNVLVQRRLAADVELLGDRAELIVLPPPCPLGVQPMDFSKADLLIEEALVASRAFLERRRAAVATTPAAAELANVA